MSQMNERKYRDYMAWFNVNIKQANTFDDLVDGTPPEEPCPGSPIKAPAMPQQQQPDYRIKVPVEPDVQPSSNSILDRLKQTAHRRSA